MLTRDKKIKFEKKKKKIDKRLNCSRYVNHFVPCDLEIFLMFNFHSNDFN